MADQLLELFKRKLDTFSNNLYVRKLKIKSKGGGGLESEYIEFILSLDDKCYELCITENIKGEFTTIYTVKNNVMDPMEKIIRKSNEREISFLQEKVPDEFNCVDDAYCKFIMDKYFEIFKLLNKEMINIKTAYCIKKIINSLESKIVDVVIFEKLKNRIENYYKPGGEGMLIAKDEFNDLNGNMVQETKD
tara:strand:- start:7211 stop:7783 length:573 start_codon:yes stop_codon:yes gene_type:complete